jgi:hypothetical protein
MPNRFHEMEESMHELGKKHVSLSNKNMEMSKLRSFTESIRKTLALESIIPRALDQLAEDFGFDGVIYLQSTPQGVTIRKNVPASEEPPIEHVPRSLCGRVEELMHDIAYQKRKFVSKLQVATANLLPMHSSMGGIGVSVDSGGDTPDAILLLRFADGSFDTMLFVCAFDCTTEADLDLKVQSWSECVGAGYSREDVNVPEIERARLDPVWDAINQLGFALSEAAVMERLQATVDRLSEKNRALKAAQKEAARATRAKGEFLAAMSHEIRTPLQAIIGYSDLLQQTVTGEQAVIVKTIQASGTILVQVINDILNYSKYNSPDFHPQRSWFNIRDVVEAAMDISAGLANDESP